MSRRAKRLLLGGCFLTCLGILAWGIRCAWQYTRPGIVHYRQGQKDAKAGHYDQARQEWTQGMDEDPSFPPCYIALGDLAFQAQRYSQAGQIYTAAARLMPDDGPLALKISLVEQKLGNLNGAYDAAHKAARLMPNDAAALAEYGFAADQQQQYAEALASLRHAVRLEPGNPKYLLALVFAEIDSYNVPGAEADLMPYLRAHPTDPKACFLAAVIYDHMPRTRQNLLVGLDYASRALASGYTVTRIYGLQGRFYLDLNRPAPALQSYQAALRLLPSDDEALRGLMECRRRLGDTVGAAQAATRLQLVATRHGEILHLKLLHRRNPQDIAVGLRLAALEEQDGNVDAAQQLYVDLAREAPSDPRTRPALSAFYRRQRRPDPAGQVLPPGFTP